MQNFFQVLIASNKKNMSAFFVSWSDLHLLHKVNPSVKLVLQVHCQQDGEGELIEILKESLLKEMVVGVHCVQILRKKHLP